MSRKPTPKRTYQVQSIDRVFAILRCFSLQKPELTLNDICDVTQLPKPTVFRLLAVLESERFIERTSDVQKYQVGIKAFELGSIFLEHLSVERIARPIMERLTEFYNMACNLAILDGGQVVYIATTDPKGPMRYSPIIGYRHYVHCSALGKALIAPLPDTEILHILKSRGMPALSPSTITNPQKLIADVRLIRERGYAIDNEEGAVGVCCIAVPLYNHQNQVIAAMSLSGIRPHFTNQTIPQIALKLKEGSGEIARQLGWRGTG